MNRALVALFAVAGLACMGVAALGGDPSWLGVAIGSFIIGSLEAWAKPQVDA